MLVPSIPMIASGPHRHPEAVLRVKSGREMSLGREVLALTATATGGRLGPSWSWTRHDSTAAGPDWYSLGRPFSAPAGSGPLTHFRFLRLPVSPRLHSAYPSPPQPLAESGTTWRVSGLD